MPESQLAVYKRHCIRLMPTGPVSDYLIEGVLLGICTMPAQIGLQYVGSLGVGEMRGGGGGQPADHPDPAGAMCPPHAPPGNCPALCRRFLLCGFRHR